MRIPELVLGVLLTIAAFAIGASVSQVLRPHEPAAVQSVQGEGAAKGGGQAAPAAKGEGNEFWQGKLTDWLLVFFTLALAVFTCMLWWSTDKLWRAGERQYELTREALAVSERNTEAAEQAAQASTEQARVAREAFENLERPYVLPQVSRLPITTSIKVKIGNYGRTPAVVHNYIGVWKIGPAENPPPVPFEDLAAGDFRNVAVVLVPQEVEEDGTTYHMPEEADELQWDRASGDRDPRIWAPDTTAFFFLKIRFEDVSGIVREGFFTWRLSATRLPHRYGGRTLNFEQIVPQDKLVAKEPTALPS